MTIFRLYEFLVPIRQMLFDQNELLVGIEKLN